MKNLTKNLLILLLMLAPSICLATTRVVVPNNANEGSLGTTALPWGGLSVASGTVQNLNVSTLTVTASMGAYVPFYITGNINTDLVHYMVNLSTGNYAACDLYLMLPNSNLQSNISNSFFGCDFGINNPSYSSGTFTVVGASSSYIYNFNNDFAVGVGSNVYGAGTLRLFAGGQYLNNDLMDFYPTEQITISSYCSSGLMILASSTTFVTPVSLSTATIYNQIGVTAGTKAVTGSVGEVLFSTFSVVTSAASGSYVTISTITFTGVGGSYVLYSVAVSSGNGATFTAGNDLIVLVSTTPATVNIGISNATFPYSLVKAAPAVSGSASFVETVISIPEQIITQPLTSMVTYYLNASATYSSGSPRWIGNIMAIRNR